MKNHDLCLELNTNIEDKHSSADALFNHTACMLIKPGLSIGGVESNQGFG